MNVPTLGERLRNERERLGLNQGSCADACGVTPRSQRNYESGERLPDAAYLARAIDIGIDVLYVLSGVRSNASLTPHLTPKEQVVFDAFRAGSAEQQEFILKAALGFSGTEAPGRDVRQRAKKVKGIMMAGDVVVAGTKKRRSEDD